MATGVTAQDGDSKATLPEGPEHPSGPISSDDAAALPPPPAITLPSVIQRLRFGQRQIEFVFRARRELGDVFAMQVGPPAADVMTGHPDDARSLFTSPDQAISTVSDSPIGPVLGPNSVLTAIGSRHMRQRKLLLPHFHGEAVQNYARAIDDAIEREIDTWPIGQPFSLAPRMQAVTLEVIMNGVFGVTDGTRRGTPEHRVRMTTKRMIDFVNRPIGQVVEFMNAGRRQPAGPGKALVRILERPFDHLIDKRRHAGDLEERSDILSLLLQSRTEEGELLTPEEVRAELLALVLAGHETTANSLSWAWERLVRSPDALGRLVDAVRTDTDREAVVEQTILETMRSRPVVPLTGRRVKVPWQLGEYAVPAETGILVSFLLIHHRDDLYPDPFAFRPERWVDAKPATYEWLPFGGGIRRCLGASLAMAEQRIVLEAMAKRVDLQCDDPAPERALNRNVTMIPQRGARVVVRSRR